jgi:hypothetical protein
VDAVRDWSDFAYAQSRQSNLATSVAVWQPIDSYVTVTGYADAGPALVGVAADGTMHTRRRRRHLRRPGPRNPALSAGIS